MSAVGEILDGLWRFEAVHPEWTEEEGGEDGWERVVAWWAVHTGRGLLLIDPLVSEWDQLDGLVAEHGGCAGIVRTIHFHQRTVAEAAQHYDTAVWAGPPAAGAPPAPLDHVLDDGAELFDGIQAFSVERFDERALWLPAQSALLFGDAMIRGKDGRLRPCPDSWTQAGGRPGAPARAPAWPGRAVPGGARAGIARSADPGRRPRGAGGGADVGDCRSETDGGPAI